MDDFPVDKIQISGAALASLLHRSSASVGDIHGYLFGIAAVSSPNALSDHPTLDGTPLLTATITSFLSLPSHLPLPPPTPPSSASAVLLGWFSARRKTPLRPSLKDSITTLSLFSSPPLAFTPQNSTLSLPPSLFLLLTTPFQDQLIHTHEYKAFQYRINKVFEPKTINIVNIGPSFRSQYDSFSPSTALPMLDCEWRESNSNLMVEDEDGMNQMKDQKQLDVFAEGFEIGRLKRLMGSEYTGELEDLYDKMLAKIDGLSKLVEQSNARVMEQENRNMILRHKVAGLE